MLGRKPEISEFTSVSAIPAVGGAPIGAIAPSPLLRKKKKKILTKIKEDEGIIPDDATPLDPESGEDASSQDQDQDLDDASSQPENEASDLLPASLALVAPDCTPEWGVPLCGSQVPAKPSAVLAPPAPSEEKTLSLEGMLGISRGARKIGFSSNGVPSPVVTESFKSGEALVGQGKPMPEPSVSNSSANTLKKFNFLS